MTSSSNGSPSPYEASHVAATYFALGCQAMRRAQEGDALKTVDVVISAFQQTPRDELFGDSMFGMLGQHILLEFKRDTESLKTEVHKPRRRLLLQTLAADATLPEMWVSLTAHFGVYADRTGKLQFTSYYKLFAPFIIEEVYPSGDPAFSLQEFSELATSGVGAREADWMLGRKSLHELRSIGVDLELMNSYLKLMLGNSPTDASGVVTGSGDSTSGVDHVGYWLSVAPNGFDYAVAPYYSDHDLAQLAIRRGVDLKYQSRDNPGQEPPPPSQGRGRGR